MNLELCSFTFQYGCSYLFYSAFKVLRTIILKEILDECLVLPSSVLGNLSYVSAYLAIHPSILSHGPLICLPIGALVLPLFCTFVEHPRHSVGIAGPCANSFPVLFKSTDRLCYLSLFTNEKSKAKYVHTDETESRKLTFQRTIYADIKICR